MVTVYEVSSPDLQATRLHLPCSAWAATILERLLYSGYTVHRTSQEPHSATRDEAELARRDALLEWASPD